MRQATIVFSIWLLLAYVGCKNNSTEPSSAPNTFTMANSTFSPASMTIQKNTTITWKNNSGVTHTSTSNTGAWDTGDIASGASKTTTFATAGTFSFHCKYHAMMTGTITVQ